MQKARTKPVEVEEVKFITFDDFVKYFYEHSEKPHVKCSFYNHDFYRLPDGKFTFSNSKDFTLNDVLVLSDNEFIVITKKSFNLMFDIIE